MPTLDTLPASSFVKLILVGHSGSGKTGSLASLVAAGYDLRIVDFDNGMDSLVNEIRRTCPDRLGSVQYEQFRDKYTGQGGVGVVIKGAPSAWINAMKAMDKWPTDQTSPETWGPKKIVVIDSLTTASKAAFEWVKAMNPSFKDPRLWYAPAQDAVEKFLMLLTAPNFNCNVIVLSHIDFSEDKEGNVTSNFVSSVGKALGPKIPRLFNTFLAMDKTGSGTNVSRKIKSLPTIMLDLKNPAPAKVSASYDISTGLAEIFKALQPQ